MRFAQNVFLEVREVVHPLLDFIDEVREGRVRQEDARFKSILYWAVVGLSSSGLW